MKSSGWWIWKKKDPRAVRTADGHLSLHRAGDLRAHAKRLRRVWFTDENCALRAAITAFAADRESTRCGQCCRNSETLPTPKNASKGERIMKLAVTYENGQIFQHFGRTAQFKLYDIEDGKIVRSEVVDTNGSGHGALAGFLMQRGVDTLICNGIGGGAQSRAGQCRHPPVRRRQRRCGCCGRKSAGERHAEFQPLPCIATIMGTRTVRGPYLRRTRLRPAFLPLSHAIPLQPLGSDNLLRRGSKRRFPRRSGCDHRRDRGRL